MLKITISPNTRFSHSITRGSLNYRTKISEEINDRVFRRMLQLYEKKNTCNIGVIKNSYNAILPERKNIEILPLPQKDCDEYSGGTRIEDTRDCITGYSIEIPTNKKKKLNILELSSFMHESTHILDYLLNPKYIANYKKMCEKDIYDKEYFEIYDKYFYNTEEMQNNGRKKMLILAEEETKKALENVPHDEKIVFLNFIKYSMEMEYHAYNQDIMYARILQKLGKPIDKESLEDFNKFLAFPEKIDLINRIIKEEIDKNRKNF